MPIMFHASDGLPHTVVAVLAQHRDRTIVLLNYMLVELMSPLERMDMLNALFAKMDGPPTGCQLDELAAPRRAHSWRTPPPPAASGTDEPTRTTDKPRSARRRKQTRAPKL